jgi:trans-2,3-dihydro-3-hydroxyanthranilate isomerase
MQLHYRIVNVFVPDNASKLTGNPLAVFESGEGLDTATMQAIALQMNLSETTFVFPPASADATARVRIFTPSYELPFAGHPTLGTAFVCAERAGGLAEVSLAMEAGVIRVTSTGDVWELQANPPTTRKHPSNGHLAPMLGLAQSDLAGEPLYVNTGVEQLIVPLASVAAVERAVADPALFSAHARNGRGACMAYLFAREGKHVTARFFWDKQGGVHEDPGTGSATANLGGYWIAQGAPLPNAVTIAQGAATGRPCQLGLRVMADKRIFVSGRVVELGRGTVQL